MNDSFLMGSFECLGDLPGNGQCLIEGNPLTRNPCGEAFTIHQFEHEELDTVDFVQAIDRGDVRMVQRGEELRFATKAPESLWIAGEGLGQDLHRDIASELGITSTVDFTHPAAAKRGDDPVRAKVNARFEEHWV